MVNDFFEFVTRLRAAWSRETSELPDTWSNDRPSTGHCAVSAIILQERFGGDIVRGTTQSGKIHYWNIIDGVTIDVTRDQFNQYTLISVLTVNPDPALYDFPYVRNKVNIVKDRMKWEN